jgi:ribosome-binding factor A
MTSRKKRWERTRAPADPFPVGDDVDPDLYFRQQAPSNRHHERQTARVCGLAFRVVSDVLMSEVSDPILQSLQVLSVDPAPDASRLSVVVCTLEPIPPDVVHARLTGAVGLLRTQLAQSLQRKRTPQLCFVVVPPTAGEVP